MHNLTHYFPTLRRRSMEQMMDDIEHHSDRVHDAIQELFDMDSVEFKDHADDMLSDFTTEEKREAQVHLELIYHAKASKMLRPQVYAARCAAFGEYMATHFLDTLDSVAQANVEARYTSARERAEIQADMEHDRRKDAEMLGENY